VVSRFFVLRILAVTPSNNAIDEVIGLSSRILLLPLSLNAPCDLSSGIEALEAVLLSIGHRSSIFARDQMSEDLLEKYDAVFLEVVGEDDLTYFMRLRCRSQKPVLIYGTEVPKSLQIESLSIGADAFLHIPDSQDVVEAKVHAFLRRSGLESFRNSGS